MQTREWLLLTGCILSMNLSFPMAEVVDFDISTQFPHL